MYNIEYIHIFYFSHRLNTLKILKCCNLVLCVANLRIFQSLTPFWAPGGGRAREEDSK